jgi:hypothetical protein
MLSDAIEGALLANRGALLNEATKPATKTGGSDMRRDDPLVRKTDAMRVLTDGAGAGEVRKAQPEADSRFNFTSLESLFAEPEERLSWVLDGILPAGGLGQLNGKPKAGKSTFVRCLALAVARGEMFLGRATVKGAVLYIALEEKRSEVKKHFQALEASGNEPILVHVDRAPANAVLAAQRAIEQYNPTLVIVDPLLKFARVKDANDYAQVTYALEPVLELARKSGAHVLLVHHAGKADKSDPVDSGVGSIGFGGGADTVLYMKRTERYRTLQTVQRYGTDLPEAVLEFDAERGAVLLGAERSKADADQVATTIVAHMRAIGGNPTQPEIEQAVEGSTKAKRDALRVLVTEGKLLRKGGGKKGDPYRYSLSGEFLFSCSEHIPGTRKQESEKTGYPAENTSEMLVPAYLEKSGESSESRDQESKPDLLPGIAPFSYPD